MKIRRILLLDPPFFRFLNEDQRSVPLGIAYLAGALRTEGFEDVVIYNADFDPKQHLGVCNRGYFDEMNRFEEYLSAITDDGHPLYHEVISTILDYQPDLIGISTRTAKFFITKTIISLLRKALGGIPIVVGGPHATANPEHVLIRTDADYVVRGEGEHSLAELIQELNRLQGTRNTKGIQNIKGLSYRQNGRIIHNPSRPLIQDLDSIPFPDRSLILHSHMMSPNDFGNIFSSRGCPFGCTFCDSRTTWSRQVRRHSPGYIVDEILDIKHKYGGSFFSFQDDCLVTREEHTIALCDEMLRAGLSDLPKTEFRWWCEIHPNLVSERLIEKMKEANCVAVAIGAESGAQRTLDGINKSSSRKTIRRAAEIIRDAGLSLSVFFMIGFPWESELNIQETLDLMEELEPDNPTVSVLTPLPGTEIYEYCRERGLVQYDQDYLTLFHQRSSHFYSEHIPDERSRSIIQDALLRCEALSKRKRRERISRFVRDHAAPAILAGEGVYLEVMELVNEGEVINADEVMNAGGIMNKEADLIGLHTSTGASSDKAKEPSRCSFKRPNVLFGSREAASTFSAPRMGITLDQNYTSEKIIVRLQWQKGDPVLADASLDRLGKMILKEFPQYTAVEIKKG